MADTSRIEAARETMGRLGIKTSDLAEAFPELEGVKERFVYGETHSQGALDERTRMLVVVDCLATIGADDLAEQMRAALGVGVEPVQLREVLHQIAPYVGLPRAEAGLRVLRGVLEEAGVELPLPEAGVVDEDSRLERGIEVQTSIFGDHITRMRASAPDDLMWMQDYLSAYCFGDTYTRGGIDLACRELLTFVAIVSLGGCDPQATAHAGGNLLVGNGVDVLRSAIATCVPYIGFPRSLNAMTAVAKALEAQGD